MSAPPCIKLLRRRTAVPVSRLQTSVLNHCVRSRRSQVPFSPRRGPPEPRSPAGTALGGAGAAAAATRDHTGRRASERRAGVAEPAHPGRMAGCMRRSRHCHVLRRLMVQFRNNLRRPAPLCRQIIALQVYIVRRSICIVQ